MANPDNQFQQGFTLSQFLALWGQHLQFKRDKRGGVVPPEGNNLRAGAERANLVDDALLALADGTFGGTTPPVALLDTRGAPINVPAILPSASFSTDVIVSDTYNLVNLMWASYFPLTGEATLPFSPGVDIEFFVDSGLNCRFFSQTITTSGMNTMFNPAALSMNPQGVQLDLVATNYKFYVKITNNDGTNTMPARLLAFVGQMFDLPQVLLPPNGIPD
jgi:hypothetical protein